MVNINHRNLDEEMFVGKDINISSESFISNEQLFSITDGKKSPHSSIKTLPPKFVITTTAATTATSTNASNPSLSWR